MPPLFFGRNRTAMGESSTSPPAAPDDAPSADASKEAAGATWGSWLSSVASSAYDTVVGAPESYQNLQPTTKLTETSNGQISAEFGEVNHEERQALWRQLVSAIGADVVNLRLSLPIWIFEPTTSLVRMAEVFEFSDLLDCAAVTEDPILRDCLVAGFVISAFSNTGRVRKPFNPILGETFEYESPTNGMRFFAEQVSHHPPLSVSHCEGDGWEAGELVDINATFWGNALEIENVGNRYISLKITGDRYTWNLPKAVVSNLFIGGAFVDHYGTIDLVNETTGTVSSLVLERCGWFSTGRHEVTGELRDKDGGHILAYKGAWNKNLDCEFPKKRVGQSMNRLWMAGTHMLPDDEGGGVGGTFAKFTKFTKELLYSDREMEATLPPTDSRLRPDLRALAQGLKAQASNEKLRVEQGQRKRRQQLKESGEEHAPRFFKKTGERTWEPTCNYWEATRDANDPQNKVKLW